MKISLVIPAYNEERYIGACLESVRQNGGGLHEIIVVDNASTDTTGEIARAYGARVVREERKGLTSAREAGRKAASGGLIAYIDADTRLPEGWVKKAIVAFTRDSHLVALSGPAHYYDAPLHMRILLWISWYLFAPAVYFLVGYMIYGANFVAKASALEAIGGFDTSIEFYGEDTNIARRLANVGRVRFDMGFYILGSARRFVAEGVFRANLRYTLNYAWPVLFNRPFTPTAHTDIRI